MEDNEDRTEKNGQPDEQNEEQIAPPEFLHGRRLGKSNYNKIIFGVCGGLGEYFSIEPVFFRLLFLLSIIMGGWGIIAYLIISLIMPGNKEVKEIDDNEYDKIKSANNVSVIAGIILLAGFYIIFEDFGYFDFLSSLGIPSQFITILLLCVIMFFIFSLQATKKIETHPKEKFFRNKEKALFGGVCSGFAEYLGVSPVSLRLIAVLLSALTLGIPALIYLFFLAVIPKEEKV